MKWVDEEYLRDHFSEWLPKKNSKDDKMKKEYEKASGINIDEQKEIWDERAKGYWGEYKIFSMLYKELDFPCKILVNLQIPSDNGRTTEIDLLLIAPTGIYVFEAKHYSGSVYGGYDKPTWTEYYKTRDSVTFENPLKQNEYHLSQLKYLLPKAQLYSYVVFTNPNASIKVGGRYPGALTVSHLEDLTEKIRGDFAGRTEVYSPEQIESMFKTLWRYSPMETDEKEFFKKDSNILPFSGFADAILKDIEQERQKIRDTVASEVKRKTRVLDKEREETLQLKNEYQGLIQAAEDERDRAVKSLKEFQKNFETVTPFTGDYGVINRDCFKAEVSFEESDSFLHTINMKFVFRDTSKELWIELLNAWFLVGLKNGSVQKYVLSKHLYNFHVGSRMRPGGHSYDGKPRQIRLFNVRLEDIKFIKLCNTVVTDRQYPEPNIAPGIEFEVFASSDVESIYDYHNPEEVAVLDGGAFELNPDFMKTTLSIEKTSDGAGSDIRFSFEAGTDEVGFDLYTAFLVIGCSDGSIRENRIYGNVKNFYGNAVMPKAKTNMLTMHLVDLKAEDIVFIKLKGLRVFRKELWQNDNLLKGVEFDLYHKD